MPTLAAKTPEQKQWLKGRNKYCSGYCNEINKQGQHEGQKPRTKQGVPMKTCPMWRTCPCQCHWNVDQLFKMVGKEREDEVPNPEYVPPVSEFRMPAYPDPLHHDVASIGDGVMTPPDAEHPVGAPTLAAAAPLASRRTPTGRATRGGLEAQVWEACRAGLPEPVTPKTVGDFIAEKYKIPTPSSGAINAVWDRWTKMGYAEQAKKPNRFVKFTGDGSWDELQRIKSSQRTKKKSEKSAALRGFR